ncbi:MAG: hypothetical protein LBT53_01390 [Puniceicoccales bacterium]|jgi:hypothetical protein|nr:hypothetical protein [Puniceicoccales bacterium]
MPNENDEILSHTGTLSAGRYYELLGKLFSVCPEAKKFPLIQHKGNDNYDIERFSAALCEVDNFDEDIKVLEIYEDDGNLSNKKFNAILLNEVTKNHDK